jgi:hypothetical protein
VLLIFPLSFFLQSANKPSCYFRVDSTGHAMVRGKVIVNDREGCKLDSPCYLAIECDGKKRDFVYAAGEAQVPIKVLDAMRSLPNKSKVKPGDLVEAEGETVQYSRHGSTIYCTKLKIVADK